MVFSSTFFLFAFLPIFLATYFIVPWLPAKNAVLLVFSLVFYAWGEPVYVLLMVISIVMNWIFGLAVGRTHGGRRFFLALDVVFNLLVLGFFKYEGFLAQNINRIFGVSVIPDLDLALPIGISFFTLQALSYVIDVYRKDVCPQKNPLYLGMYIAMFPQLVAGPIVRYSQIEKSIISREVTFTGFVQGLRLFIVGLGKKVLLANVAGTLADSLLVQDASAIGFVGCFSGVLAYSFQIYFDFSGYSDMAIGLGKMCGFNYSRNFNYPYISTSVTEFWRRWHMSLGSFFRDYVYIPLGGSRVSTPRWMFNIMVVWGLTGIWHGAAWNFLLWGLYYGVLLMCEKQFLLKVLDRCPRVITHVYALMVAFIGWLLFAVNGLGRVGEWLIGLFGGYGFTGTSTLWELQSWSYVSLLPIMIIACLPVVPLLRKKLQMWAEGKKGEDVVAAPEKGNEGVPPCALQVSTFVSPTRMYVCRSVSTVVDVALLAILIASTISIVSSSYNPFIYFQF